MNNINKIVINTGLPGFVLIDWITEAGAGNVSGVKDFADAPVYLIIESLAQLGAYHVRFLTQFERHAFLLKITRCRMPEEDVLNGRYLLHGQLIHRSESAFAYKLQAKKENENNPLLPPFTKGGQEELSDETHIDGFVKSQKTPSPLMGEGWGEGDLSRISNGYNPLPLIPSHQGRGNPTFYESVNIEGEFLFATVDYNSTFKKEILQDHYRKVFSCLQNDIKTD